MTHCNGINAHAAIQLYETLLKSLGVPLEFTQTRAYVPSFQVRAHVHTDKSICAFIPGKSPRS